jgi:hypothetical protein
LLIGLKALLAGFLASVNDALKSHYLNKQALRANEAESVENTDNVVKFTQNLVSGELTEQLMRLVRF